MSIDYCSAPTAPPWPKSCAPPIGSRIPCGASSAVPWSTTWACRSPALSARRGNRLTGSSARSVISGREPPPQLQLFRPHRDSGQPPQGALADRIPFLLYLRPAENLFLNRSRQVQQIHDLGNAGARHPSSARQLGV